jgi:hypothetical protein
MRIPESEKWYLAARSRVHAGSGRVRLQLYQQAHKSPRYIGCCVDNEIQAGGGGGGCRLVIDEHRQCISGQCFGREHRSRTHTSRAEFSKCIECVRQSVNKKRVNHAGCHCGRQLGMPATYSHALIGCDTFC